MSFEVAIRLIEVGLGFALFQQSAEHLVARGTDRVIFALRVVFATALMAGIGTLAALICLVCSGLWMLHRYGGPYNGGADKMATLILWCLTAAHLSGGVWAELFIAYLAVQLLLSYFVSGQVKIMNPSWRSGEALCDVFAYSTYPVGQNLRGLSKNVPLMKAGAWGVIGFEVLFPISMFHPLTLLIALAIAALFHFANACSFGLNRFFWAWLAAFPALIWLQARIFGLT